MLTLSALIDQIMGNLDKIETHGVQSMLYIVKSYQDLQVLKEGVEKLEKELKNNGRRDDIEE